MPVPLDLYAEVTTASGTRFRWDANQAPGSRLRNFSFRTKVGEGFSDGGGQLARRVDLDHPDLNLVDLVTFVGADGTVAYEGQVAAMPRELADTHSIGVTLAGCMAQAKRRKFTQVYVDRDLGAWGAMSLARKTTVVTGNDNPQDPEQAADPADGTASVITHVDGAWASPYTLRSEAWYDPGPGLTIGAIAYTWRRESAAIDPTILTWAWAARVADDDKATNDQNTGNLRSAGPGSGLFTPTVSYRYAWLSLWNSGTPGGADGARYAIDWSKLAVYGSSGIPTYTGEPGEPAGVYASDVMRDICASYCPGLDPSGIADSTYVIQHLAFKDRTYPYDAFLELNKFHLWHLGVWENRKLVFRPYDFSDYDWEIRTDDPGVTFSPQGPSTESVFNGVVITYTDLLTGVRNVLTPADYPELADASLSNPWNQHGESNWDEIELSTPQLQASALQMGRAFLADRIRPKTPGTITVRGYIRDRAGNLQPGWKVRAGDMISVTNFPNDTPRLVSETTWDDESKTLTVTVDNPSPVLDAYIDRLTNALSAKNLG